MMQRGRGRGKRLVQTTLGKAPPVSSFGDNNNGPDRSELLQPIGTSVSGLRQVVTLYQTATEEVKHYLSYECDVIYECRKCRSLHRSIANFILHKREFCREGYCPQRDTAQSIIHTPVPNASVSPKKTIASAISKMVARQKCDEICTAAVDKDETKKSFFKGASVALEVIDQNKSGVFQTVLTSSGEDEEEDLHLSDKELTKSEVAEIHKVLNNNGAVLTADGKIATRPGAKSLHLVCKFCRNRFATKKTLTHHVNYMHSDTRIVYLCPENDCDADVFSNSWSVFRHLYKVHRKTHSQVKKMRGMIQTSVLMRGDVAKRAPPRTNKNAVKKLNIDNTRWMDNYEGDGAYQVCGGCGKRFERRAALNAHLQTCQSQKKLSDSESDEEHDVKEVVEEKKKARRDGQNKSEQQAQLPKMAVEDERKVAGSRKRKALHVVQKRAITEKDFDERMIQLILQDETFSQMFGKEVDKKRGVFEMSDIRKDNKENTTDSDLPEKKIRREEESSMVPQIIHGMATEQKPHTSKDKSDLDEGATPLKRQVMEDRLAEEKNAFLSSTEKKDRKEENTKVYEKDGQQEEDIFSKKNIQKTDKNEIEDVVLKKTGQMIDTNEDEVIPLKKKMVHKIRRDEEETPSLAKKNRCDENKMVYKRDSLEEEVIPSKKMQNVHIDKKEDILSKEKIHKIDGTEEEDISSKKKVQKICRYTEEGMPSLSKVHQIDEEEEEDMPSLSKVQTMDGTEEKGKPLKLKVLKIGREEEKGIPYLPVVHKIDGIEDEDEPLGSKQLQVEREEGLEINNEDIATKMNFRSMIRDNYWELPFKLHVNKSGGRVYLPSKLQQGKDKVLGLNPPSLDVKPSTLSTVETGQEVSTVELQPSTSIEKTRTVLKNKLQSDGNAQFAELQEVSSGIGQPMKLQEVSGKIGQPIRLKEVSGDEHSAKLQESSLKLQELLNSESHSMKIQDIPDGYGQSMKLPEQFVKPQDASAGNSLKLQMLTSGGTSQYMKLQDQFVKQQKQSIKLEEMSTRNTHPMKLQEVLGGKTQLMNVQEMSRIKTRTMKLQEMSDENNQSVKLHDQLVIVQEASGGSSQSVKQRKQSVKVQEGSAGIVHPIKLQVSGVETLTSKLHELSGKLEKLEEVVSSDSQTLKLQEVGKIQSVKLQEVADGKSQSVKLQGLSGGKSQSLKLKEVSGCNSQLVKLQEVAKRIPQAVKPLVTKEVSTVNTRCLKLQPAIQASQQRLKNTPEGRKKMCGILPDVANNALNNLPREMNELRKVTGVSSLNNGEIERLQMSKDGKSGMRKSQGENEAVIIVKSDESKDLRALKSEDEAESTNCYGLKPRKRKEGLCSTRGTNVRNSDAVSSNSSETSTLSRNQLDVSPSCNREDSEASSSSDVILINGSEDRVLLIEEQVRVPETVLTEKDEVVFLSDDDEDDEDVVTLETKAAPYMDLNTRKCLPCNSFHKTIDALLKHMATHFKWFHFQCNECLFKSYDHTTLRAHLLKQHAVPVGELERYTVRLTHHEIVRNSVDFQALLFDEQGGWTRSSMAADPSVRRMVMEVIFGSAATPQQMWKKGGS